MLIIEKYEDYQDSCLQSTNEQQTNQQTNNKRTTNEQQQLKNIINKEDSIYSPIGEVITSPQGNDSKVDINKSFEEWYLTYPKHTSKKKLLKYTLKLVKVSYPQSYLTQLLNIKNNCLLNKTDIKYIKHPTTWLNQGCWDDEYAGSSKPQMSDKTKEFFDKYKKGE